jgi:DNA primase
LSFCFLPPEHDPDSYIREYGKEAFEVMLNNALPLSQYIVQELAEKEDMGSSEGRVRFLNEAAPLLKQIQAQKMSVMLRNQIAKLADVSVEEMNTLLQLQQPKGPSARTLGRSPRTAPTLTRKFLQMVLQRPPLALQLPLQQLPQKTREDDFLLRLIETAQANPQFSGARLLDRLGGSGAEPLIDELSAWLITADDEFEVEHDFAGALKLLDETGRKKDMAALLEQVQQKSISELTQEERALLQQYGKPRTNKQ